MTRDELRDYLKGAKKVTLIGIESVVALSSPISLTELRRRNHRMVIPQSYRFMNENEVRTIATDCCSLGEL